MSEQGRWAARFLAVAAPLLRGDRVRLLTRLLSGAHAAVYRLTGGRAQVRAYPTALLTVTGRRTGTPRTVPLVYLQDGDRYVVAAAYAGSDRDPSWWLNLQANPEAQLEVGRQRLPVSAALAPPGERDQLWRRLVGMYRPFAQYQRGTARQIPVIVLRPRPAEPHRDG